MTGASGEQSPADRYRAAETAFWAHHGAPEPTEHWIEVRSQGIKVRVLEAGTGTPVLFVHGGPNAGSTWAPVVAGMLDSRCLVLDRPGCGLSEAIDYTDMSAAEVSKAMVDTLLATVEDLVDEPVDLVGSSYGGACVLWMTDAHPSRVRRVVIEGVPAIDGMQLAMNLRILAIGPIGRFIAGRSASVGDIRRTFKQIGHRRLVEGGWPEGPDRDWGLSMMNDTRTMANEVALIQRGATWRGFRPGLFDPDALGEIEQSALWLVGDNDPFATVETVKRWAAAMPNSELEVLEGSGHLPWIDDSPGHARRISAFLAER